MWKRFKSWLFFKLFKEILNQEFEEPEDWRMGGILADETADRIVTELITTVVDGKKVVKDKQTGVIIKGKSDYQRATQKALEEGKPLGEIIGK